MDRDFILKHSKAIRLNGKVLPDFVQLFVQYCENVGHSEHSNKFLTIIQIPMIQQELILHILEHFEKKFNIIRLEKPEVNSGFFSGNKQTIINIY